MNLTLVIAAPSDSAISAWRTALDGIPDVRFRIGKMPAIADGCDAAIVPAYLALDRYGGTPSREARVAENRRNDGLPSRIVVTPGYGPVAEKVESSNLSGPIQSMFTSCLRAVEEFNHLAVAQPIRTLLIHVVAIGFPAVDDIVIASAFRNAYIETQV
ncbi:hypothetical protein [Nocardia cyriacigeorgica]|uniref:Uncharacterized protein n=1 Tax=Nocardia cyriacigeorgica TaxID=135487 RepID=A0A5R8NV48_9NOCA|nr:hypothetical protein [Nocardia cyriacigeorgica]TLF79621.1 hypothetical protein FEK34_09910 [Nocardia cyriacigeorgica]